MQILAHRGIFTSSPENSLEALMAAVHSDFGIETDVRLTKDNDFLLMHDETFERLASATTRISDVTLAEATSMRYTGSQTNFISLRTLLESCKAERKTPVIALHLKADSQNEISFQKLSAYFKEYNLYEKAFIFDLSLEMAKLCKSIDDKIQIGLIICDQPFGPTSYKWDDVKQETCFDIVWAAEYRNLYTEALFNEMKQLKNKLYVVSPDIHIELGHPLALDGYQKSWENIIAWRAHGICTDKPYQLSTLLKKIQE